MGDVPESLSILLRRLPATFILWDIDHTLIENSGVSKEVYALAFELLTKHVPLVRPSTDGRTDFQIMQELFKANTIDASEYSSISQFEGVLTEAMTRKVPELLKRGYPLKGAAESLEALTPVPTIIQSVLTGNIVDNAKAKLHAFGLDEWVDFDVGGYGSDHTIRSQLVDIARQKAKQKYDVAFDKLSTILIGDTPLDVKAARDGGAKIIGVATGSSSMNVLHEAGADAVIESLEHLDQLIMELIELRLDGTEISSR